MTLDKFTIKAQEAVQAAVNTAQMNGQQVIEPVHILKGVLEKAKDVTTFIFQKLGVNAQQIEMLVDNEIQHLPKVQGGQPSRSNICRRCRAVNPISLTILIMYSCAHKRSPPNRATSSWRVSPCYRHSSL